MSYENEYTPRENSFLRELIFVKSRNINRFSKEYGINRDQLRSLILLHISPFLCSGKGLRPAVVKLLSIFEMSLEDLFPRELYNYSLDDLDLYQRTFQPVVVEKRDFFDDVGKFVIRHKVLNNKILSSFDSRRRFCQYLGIHQNSLYDLLALRKSPLDPKGRRRIVAHKISLALEMDFDDLFTYELYGVREVKRIVFYQVGSQSVPVEEKNFFLRKLILSQYPTLGVFCKRHSLNPTHLSSLLNLNKSPLDHHCGFGYFFSPVAKKVIEIFDFDYQTLFPAELYGFRYL